MSYTEIHFHLLPGIDDGPATLQDSVELAAAAAADGTAAILTTPHIHPEHVTDVSSLPERVREVAERLAREQIAVDVHCGGELDVGMVARLTQSDLEVIAAGPQDARWVLLEAPLSGLGQSFTAAADELRARGFGVVMAHPERSMADREAGWAAIEHELAVGGVIQVNAWSLGGVYGDGVRAHALRGPAPRPARRARLRRPRPPSPAVSQCRTAGARARARARHGPARRGTVRRAAHPRLVRAPGAGCLAHGGHAMRARRASAIG